MQSIRWLGLGISNALTKTVVHFFPSAGNVTAPYPAQCKLTIFGQAIGRRSVVLDGARLSQPDGVKLEAAFPVLQEGLINMFGLIVELNSQQPRIDMTSSSCLVELTSSSPSVKYSPHETYDNESYLPKSGVAFKDAYTSSSLVMVNASGEIHRPPLNPGFTVEGIASDCIMEVELGEPFFKDVEPKECNWGLSRVRAVEVPNEIPSSVAYFTVLRDVNTKRPVTIAAL